MIHKIIISISALIASISLLFFFVIRPILADRETEMFYEGCINKLEEIKKVRNETLNKMKDAGRISNDNLIKIIIDYEKGEEECYQKYKK